MYEIQGLETMQIDFNQCKRAYQIFDDFDFQGFQGWELVKIKFHDFPGFQVPIQFLTSFLDKWKDLR